MTSLLSISNVSKAYPDGSGRTVVFDRATLDVPAGAHVGVYGRRRSGKSTLTRIAAGIDRPDAGSVTFDGHDLTRISGKEHARLLRSRLAYLTVSDWRPNPGESVAHHLAVSLGGNGLTVAEAERRALRELDVVEVSGALAHSPATQLSMLDRTRVMLARALAREPLLLVVDEPVHTPIAQERDSLYLLMRQLARRRGVALLVASEDFLALHGFDVLMSISSRELISSESNGTVVPFPGIAPRLGPIHETGS